MIFSFRRLLADTLPHEFKEIHLTKHINACDLHLKRNEFDPFLKRICKTFSRIKKNPVGKKAVRDQRNLKV